MSSWLSRSLVERAPRNHRESEQALGRRQAVTLLVLVIGAAMLGTSLRIEPGSTWFYAATGALAAVWTIGALASGPLHLGHILSRDELRRPVLAPVLIGLALAGVFTLGGLLVRQVPFLEDQVMAVLDHADEGSLLVVAALAVVNGVAEELFFRGAAYAALPWHPVVLTTLAYALATLITGNAMLVVAALVLGTVVGLERRASGGVLAPALTHVTWSLSMLFLLPLVFG